MAPIAKENDLLTATPESAARPSASAPVPSDNAVKQQPVALVDAKAGADAGHREHRSELDGLALGQSGAVIGNDDPQRV